MTDEEKKQTEAATAEAVKKAVAETEAKLKAVEPSKELAEAKARITELNEENKKHRLTAKEKAELVDKQAKVLELLTGKPGETPDPVKLEKDKADARVRRAFLKAAFVGEAAKVMHDADFAFEASVSELKDVDVDVESGKVDRAKVQEKLAEIKKTKPFLFVPEGNGAPPKQVKNPPDGGGSPGGTGNPYSEWRKLKEAGHAQAAQQFYEKNRADIAANMPK